MNGMTSMAGTRCARHVEREAVAMCARCGDFACSACCAPNEAGATYCNECLETTALVTASRGARLLAQIVNSAIFVLLCTPLIFLDELSAEVGLALTTGVGLGFLVLIGVNIYLLATRGQSLGKLAVGIRIVRTDGQPAGLVSLVLMRIFVPQLIQVFCGIFSLIDSLSIFSEDSRCIHDKIAGTIVVNDDLQRARPRAF